jgi:curved DNA-binding protein CbpA
MAIDPYRTLGLQPGATAAEVKRAYRRLAKANHPDSAGPAALPRFLAIHEAYEALTRGTKPARSSRTAAETARSGAGAAAAAAAGEPWRADPARARAAREQARARSRTSSAGAGGPASAEPAAGASGGPTTAGARGAGAGSRAGTGAGATGAGAKGAGAGTGASAGTRSGGTSSRRRASRKATLGSTSYDEARETTDTSWAGAAWYGPTSGEYWHVNPREYADPRKHGPQYQSRGRRSETSGEAWDPEPPETEASPGPSSSNAERPASERTWTPPPRNPERRDPGRGRVADDPTFAETLTSLGRRLDREPNDPLRRLGYALVAWAPVGLAVAAVVGGATGCTSYGAGCTGAAPMIPWLLQAAILGLLLLLPRLARILATGTAAVLLALAPLTGLLLAFGGSGEPAAPGMLQTLLTIVWAGGVALGVYAATRIRRTPRPSP